MNVGKLVDHRYKIKKILGEGGIGTVYLVNDLHMDDEKALKIVKYGFVTESVSNKFSKEFRILHQLKHPGVVQCYEYGLDYQNAEYFTMEVIDWPTLSQINIKLPEKDIIRLLIEIVEVLAFVHNHQISHLDIKPNNIFVNERALLQGGESESPLIKIGDFGLSAQYRAGDAYQRMGTFTYSSPEMFFPDKVGMHADIFSVGMIGFTLLSDTIPYSDSNYSQSIEKKLHWLPTQYMWDKANVSARLASILTRCLNPNPSLRPRNTNELLTELCAIGSKNRSIRPKDIKAPFVGRSNQLRHLSITFNKVCNGEHWAVLIHGEAGIGKSRLIDEFAVRQQLNGHQVIRIDGNDIRMLLRYYNIHQEEATLSYKEFEEAWAQIIYSHEENPTQLPLIICWHNFQDADDSKVKLIKNLIFNHPELRLMWLLEADSIVSQLSTLTYFNHLLRREVTELQEKDVSSLVSKLFGEPFGFFPLSQNIFSFVGGKPAWLIHLIRKLIEIEHIKYKLGKWYIPNPDISECFESLADVFKFDLSQLSKPAQWVIEWLAVLDKQCSIDSLKSELEISDEVWSDTVNEIRGIGLIEITGEFVIFALPIFREIIYRALTPSLKESLHHAIGSWYEGNFTEIDSLEGLLSIAKHFYLGKQSNSFLRVMERTLESTSGSSQYRIDEWYLLTALEITENPLDDKHKYLCLDILGRSYFQKKKYEKAAETFKNLLDEPKFKKFINYPLTQLNLGKCYILIPDFKQALEQLNIAYKSFQKKNPAMAGEALSRLIYIHQRQGDYEIGLALVRQYHKLIPGISKINEQLPHWIKCARLFMLHNEFDDAIQCNSVVLDRNQKITDNKSLVMNAYNIQIEIMIRKSDWHGAIKIIDYIETNHLSLKFGSWQYIHLRATALISGGQIERGLLLMDKIEQTIKTEAIPIWQCYILLDLIRISWFAGKYTEGMRKIRQAMGVARRDGILYMEAIISSWAVLYRDMGNLPVDKLIEYTNKLIEKADHSISNAVASFNLAEHHLNKNEPAIALPLLETCSYDSTLIDYDIPKTVIDLMILRCQFEMSLVIGSVDWEKHENLSDRLVHGLSKGSYYYHMMNLAICTKEEKYARHFYEKATSSFKAMNAHFMVSNCLYKYGDACRRQYWSDDSRKFISKAAHINIGLGLPLKQMDSQMSNQFAVEQSDRFPALHELAKIIDTLNSMKSSDRLAQRLLELALESVNAERGLLIFKNNKGAQLSHKASIRVGKAEEQAISRTLVEKVFNSQEAMIVENAMEDEFMSSLESVQLNRIFAVACLPIVVNEKIEGVLYLDHGGSSRSFSETDRSYLSLLTNLIGTVISHNRMLEILQEDVRVLRYNVDQLQGYDEIIGQSKAMRKIFSLLLLLKTHDISVLILGESGTGKELISRVIHRQSSRSSKPFFAINCAAIQDTLIESLLFGHVKGAFTGADSDNVGFFEKADGGTIFLDEVDEMSIAMQGKILRVLQEGEFYAVGDTKIKKSNVRLITAAKHTLPKLVEEGKFREDLYYRINVVQIDAPPLRERISDILPIAHFYINEHCKKNGLKIRGIKKNAEIILQRYFWPGNVRQLENVIQHIFLFVQDNQFIDVQHLPENISAEVFTSIDVNETLETKVGRLEKQIIQDNLFQHGGNKSKVARILGVSRPTLIKKINKYELEDNIEINFDT